MTDDTFQDIRTKALAELSAGPMTMAELTKRLKAGGAIPAGWDEDDVDELLLDVDECWTGDGGLVASTEVLLDGVVLSHRVTASELLRGVLDVTPDLGVIDYDADVLDWAGGGHLERRYPFGGEPELDDDGSLVGPPGWLSTCGAGDIVCLHRSGRTVSLHRREDLRSGAEEERALRAALAVRHTVGVGVEADPLVLEALCQDPTLFRTPAPPISELLERIGLERRGAWFGLAGEDWAPPGVRSLERALEKRRESWGFSACCEAAFQTAVDAWLGTSSESRSTPAPDLRHLAKALRHGSVAPAFAEHVLGGHEHGDGRLADFATMIAALPGALAAPGLFLRALNAERDGRTADGEADLRRAAVADPEFGPALAELAWYVADRGDGDRAMSLLRQAGVEADDPELGYLGTRRATPAFKAGRNDPCPCGSGRKFKTCCLGGGAEPIEARSGWLYHKIITFTLRPMRRHHVEDLFEIAAALARPQALGDLLPILVDVAAFEGGGITAFVAQRGELLPADELVLARSWLTSRLAMWEIVDRDPGQTVTMRNTRTGDQVVVTERTASQTLRQGEYLLARVVVAGSQYQIIGLPLNVELRPRGALMALLDSEPGAAAIASWVGAAFAPPRFANREGEETILCRAVLRPASTPWDKLVAVLDENFGSTGDRQWAERALVDGDDVVRCFMRREDEDLVVETNSVERLDRLLGTLRELVSDLVVVDDERLTPDQASARGTAVADPSAWPPGEMPPEVDLAIQNLLLRKELEWIDEAVPALGGLTPREAAADPSRREDLLSLLREFEGREVSGPGLHSFSAARLREQLGL